MLTLQDFEGMEAINDDPDEDDRPEIDFARAVDQAPVISFFEQGFEWQQMT